ncbi:Hypothetical predicted protein [Xyrichtys novacula]|uniref:Uncharacterized protein n=1 Tax=Xyrichtys novacula TaxID=13765 RepID=A0AAV1G9Z7_XYRNO|nr:Hypothetical predicted protein [Xyrichtys novacula]
MRRDLVNQEVELVVEGRVGEVDRWRGVGDRHGHGVVPPQQLLYDAPHVQPMTVLARKDQNMTRISLGGGIEEQEEEERSRKEETKTKMKPLKKKRRKNLHDEWKQKSAAEFDLV